MLASMLQGTYSWLKTALRINLANIRSSLFWLETFYNNISEIVDLRKCIFGCPLCVWYFAHVLWGSTKPVSVLTDNKSLTRFSQAITILSGLWTCVDHVLNFNFVLGHIPGKANAAAGYLSCVHINPHFNIQMHFNAKLPVREVTLTMGMQVPDNSLNTLYLNCEDLMTPQKLKYFPLNWMPYMLLVPLDTFELFTAKNQLDLRLEQHNDPNISVVLEWLEKGPPPPSPYLSSELSKYLTSRSTWKLQWYPIPQIFWLYGSQHPPPICWPSAFETRCPPPHS